MLLRRSWLKRVERTNSVLLSRLEMTKATAAPETTRPGTTETSSSTRPKPRAARGEEKGFIASVRAAPGAVVGQAAGGVEGLAEQAAAEAVDRQVDLVDHRAGRREQADRAGVAGL